MKATSLERYKKVLKFSKADEYDDNIVLKSLPSIIDLMNCLSLKS